MLRSRCLCALAALAAASLPAQTNTASVNDVGLTMDGGLLTVIYGQACGPFTCTPFPAGPLGTSANSRTRTITVHGAPTSFYVLAMSIAPPTSPCLRIPGIGNALILGLPATTLAFGITSAAVPSPSAACRQGQGRYVLTVPATAPAGIRIGLQALANSETRGLALTVALETRIP
jgi:hypothetical protein